MYKTKITYETTSPLRGVIEKVSAAGETLKQIFILKDGDNIKTVPVLFGKEAEEVIDFAKSVAMV